MAFTKYPKRGSRRKSARTESPEDALARIEASKNEANYPAIVAAFVARGIAAADMIPRENVFTYRAWQGKSRQVRKGEKSVKIDVWIEYDKEVRGEPTKARARRSVAVFHVSQTEEMAAGAELPATRPASDRPSDEPAARRTESSEAKPAPRSTKPAGVSAERLRTLADNMQTRIDAKLNPAIANQNWTRRRADIAAGMRQDAYRLQDVQRARLKLADAIDNETLPAFLVGIYSESDLAELTRQAYASDSASEVAAKRDARAWLTGDYESDGQRAAREQAERHNTLRDAIMASPPDGFFPTPASLAARMVALAKIEAGDEVLEPSAGTGSIAQAILDDADARDIDVSLMLVEQNSRLCEFLGNVGFAAHCADVMKVRGTVDRVIMNPPYEGKQDLRHVRHCFGMVKPGGLLVALVSAGFQFRADHETVEFREWLQTETIVDHCEIIEDAFKGPESLRQTGVRVALIVLRKAVN